MINYRPTGSFTTPLMLLIPTTTVVSGVTKKTYPNMEDGILFFGSCKTYGGTETKINNVWAVEKTVTIEAWYRPDVKSDCRIGLVDKGKIYEVIGEPEDIEERHQFMKFKAKHISGGV